MLVAVTVFFLWWVDRFFPLRHWVFFVYLQAWLCVAMFAAASLVTGLRLLTLLMPEAPPLGQRLLLGLALGVLTFFWGVFLAGVLGLYGHVFFFAWPAAMLAFGGPAAWRLARRSVRHLRRLKARWYVPRGIVDALGAAVLTLGCVAVYLQVLTPANIGADSVSYHLPIAEHYVTAGGIRPFLEGWYNGALPQLASVLYTWAFQSPGSLGFHIVLSGHIEFFLFLATLAGISGLVRVLVGVRAPYASALMFAFPGFLAYDSNLIVGADHVLAFWAPPLALALVKFARRFEQRRAVLAGLVTAGALLTKYQSLYLLVPTALLIIVLAIRARQPRPLLVWGLVAVAACAPHWAKNWIFYGDPLYPFLRRWFPSHPFPPGAAELMSRVLTPPQFRFTGTWDVKLRDLAQILVSFSFVPHDWGFHGARPVFGSLFTCLLVGLPFVKARARIWAMVAGVHLGVVTWFVTAHEDRYLQAILPWMVAVAATLLFLLWHRGILARVAVVLLLAAQVVYGSDVYFYRVHAMIGDSPLKAFVDNVSLGQTGRFAERARLWGDLQRCDVSRRVPKGSKVLINHFTEKLGIGVPSVMGCGGCQGAIDYAAHTTPAETLAVWKSVGVTHAWWRPNLPDLSADLAAREAVFQRAISLFAPTAVSIDQYRLGTVELHRPLPAAATTPTRIAWIGCAKDPPTGLYDARALSERRPPANPGLPLAKRDPVAALLPANVVVLHPACGPSAEMTAAIKADFVQATRAGDLVFYVRRPVP
ncbi:MAG TPA: hypothetical protein VMU50_08385 [Polyangia bacterium]|nr:hypothetical protein [Polyangia bacterium]